MKNTIGHLIVGNIGLFHVCYELSRRGFNVVPTSRNTRAVDIIVGSADFSKSVTVQVKTNRTKTSPEIGKASELKTKEEALEVARIANFWVQVMLKKDCSVDYVIVWPGDDEELIIKNEKSWLFPTQRKKYEKIFESYINNWSRIEEKLK